MPWRDHFLRTMLVEALRAEDHEVLATGDMVEAQRWLLDAARASAMPYLPGAVSPSELMLGMEYGYEWFKIFPAMATFPCM